MNMRNAFSGKRFSILLVVGFAIVLALPMLLYGPLIDGHDTHEHLNYIKHFSEQFWTGNLYPRWLIGMNAGLGSPTFFVFPPLPAYVSVMLEPAARLLHFDAFNFAAFLALAISGITSFLWLRTLVSEKIATICALLYMLMPYHLAIDFYRRCALPECWAMAWMPLVLYFAQNIIRGKRRSEIGLAFAFALMIISHLISVAMFFPIPIILAILFSDKGRRFSTALQVAAAMAAGTGLASFYLLSALANAKFISASKITVVFKWSENLVSLGKGLFIHGGADPFVQTISWTVVTMIIVTLVCGIALLKWATRDAKPGILFWTALVCGGSVFCMSRASTPIWRHVHKLAEAVQFPWRFNGILCLGAVWLLALFFSNLSRIPRTPMIISVSVLILVFGGWVVSYGNVWHRYKVDVWRPPHDERHLINESDGWFYAWLPEGTVQSSTLAAGAGPKARFKDGQGDARVMLWAPRDLELETNSSNGGWVMVNQFYYPTWEGKLRGTPGRLEVRAAMPEGLLEVHVPAGLQNVQIQIPPSWEERFGQWISAASLVLCLLAFFRKERENRSLQNAVPALNAGAAAI